MGSKVLESEVKDRGLAPKGQKKIEWARRNMGILSKVRKRFSREKPFRGKKLALCIHLESKTACLARTLRVGGAELAVSSSNPLSTQDDVAAALAETEGIKVFAKRGLTQEEYNDCLLQVLEIQPDIVIDDGGDLTKLLHGEKSELAGKVIGGCEETTTGVNRLKALNRKGKLKFPMFNVNDAKMKHFFDNRYGTGQSTWEGIMRATNLSIAGKTVAVAGYGWCGRGIALRAKGLGADVIVTEVDPVKAVEAKMDGFGVMKMAEAVEEADIIVSSTGCKGVVTEKMFGEMKDGAIMANAGHFDVEIDKERLEKISQGSKELRKDVKEYKLENGKKLYLLADGRLVNLVAGDGHPVEIMDTSFALQSLTAEYILKNREKLEPKLYPVPEEIDRKVAEMKLEAMGVEIDKLTPEQKEYLDSWD